MADITNIAETENFAPQKTEEIKKHVPTWFDTRASSRAGALLHALGMGDHYVTTGRYAALIRGSNPLGNVRYISMNNDPNVRVRHALPDVVGAPLSVTVSGKDILVSLSTDASGNCATVANALPRLLSPEMRSSVDLYLVGTTSNVVVPAGTQVTTAFGTAFQTVLDTTFATASPWEFRAYTAGTFVHDAGYTNEIWYAITGGVQLQDDSVFYDALLSGSLTVVNGSVTWARVAMGEQVSCYAKVRAEAVLPGPVEAMARTLTIRPQMIPYGWRAVTNLADANLGVPAISTSSLVQALAASPEVLKLVRVKVANSADEVVGSTQDYVPLEPEGLEGARRDILLNYASGADLTVIGNNFGLPRPVRLSFSDAKYRAYLTALAFSKKCGRSIIEDLLTLVLGPKETAGWAVYELRRKTITIELPAQQVSATVATACYPRANASTTSTSTRTGDYLRPSAASKAWGKVKPNGVFSALASVANNSPYVRSNGRNRVGLIEALKLVKAAGVKVEFVSRG